MSFLQTRNDLGGALDGHDKIKLTHDLSNENFKSVMGPERVNGLLKNTPESIEKIFDALLSQENLLQDLPVDAKRSSPGHLVRDGNIDGRNVTIAVSSDVESHAFKEGTIFIEDPHT